MAAIAPGAQSKPPSDIEKSIGRDQASRSDRYIIPSKQHPPTNLMTSNDIKAASPMLALPDGAQLIAPFITNKKHG